MWRKDPENAFENEISYDCAQKDKYALILTDIGDYNRSLLWLDFSCAPKTIESLPFRTADVGRRVDNGKLR